MNGALGWGMNNEIEYNGYWWLPGQNKGRIYGNLKINTSADSRIELIDDLQRQILDNNELGTLHKSVINYEEIILGQTIDGTRITLYKCTKERDCFKNDFHYFCYIVGYVFVGCHFETKEEIEFDSVSIRYSSLEYWLESSSFQSYRNIREKEIGIIWKLSNSISYDIEDFKISFKWKTSANPFNSVSLEIQRHAFVQIEPNCSKNFNFYLEKHRMFQIFLSFGTGRPVYPLEIIGIQNNSKLEPSFFDIKIYCNYTPDWREDNVSPKQMLFSYTDISSIFTTCIQNWYIKYHNLEPVYGLYFGVIYDQNMYLQNMFLNLAQAVESYHRRTLGGKYLSDDEYEIIKEHLIKSISKDVDSSFRESLVNKIKYGNEFSLRKRLKAIFEKIKENGLNL